MNEIEYDPYLYRKSQPDEVVGVEDARTGQTYYLNLGQRADEHTLHDIITSLQKSGVKINLVKYPVYGAPIVLKKDPIRNLKAYAVGKWLASRKNKRRKKQKNIAKNKKTTKSHKTHKRHICRRK